MSQIINIKEIFYAKFILKLNKMFNNLKSIKLFSLISIKTKKEVYTQKIKYKSSKSDIKKYINLFNKIYNNIYIV